MTRISFILGIFSILFVSTNVKAEWRCDCTKVTGSCRGTVVVEGNGISVSSDSQQCSRVDYFVDGQPFVTVAVEGKAKEAWLSGTEKSKIMVQSCQVCADSLHKTVPVVQSTPPLLGSDDAQPVNVDYLPVVKFDPVYPEAALASGLEGYVIVKAIVGESGRVQGVRVVGSNPSRVFDNAALATVRRWRYPPREAGAADVETQERVTFSLGNRRISTSSSNKTTQLATTNTPGSLNQCVREADVLRQRGRHEIQVRNVCSEPLIVYSCSEGVGANHGRWSCSSVTDRGTILVEEGDARAGRSMSQYKGGGAKKFLYAERHSIYTASTDRYWWIACSFGDTECRASAVRWRDSLHNRPTQIKPDTKLTKVSRSR